MKVPFIKGLTLLLTARAMGLPLPSKTPLTSATDTASLPGSPNVTPPLVHNLQELSNDTRYKELCQESAREALANRNSWYKQEEPKFIDRSGR